MSFEDYLSPLEQEELKRFKKLQAIKSIGNVEKPHKPGYHIEVIPRGTFGEVSKIREELAELEDAMAQDVKIMVLCELSDLYEAIRAVTGNLGVTMNDLEKMADVTARAFESGRRVSNDASTKQLSD